MTLIDLAGSGQTDLLVWSSQGIHLYRHGQQPAGKHLALRAWTGVNRCRAGRFST